MQIAKILLSFAILLSTSANAAFILNNDNNSVVNPFLLTESFESFYGYGEDTRSSSNTGFEKNNTAVFILAEYQNQFSLIATFGAFVSDGDLDGARFLLSLTNNGFGNFLFVDDPSDPVTVSANATNVNYSYFADRTDGFIFGLGDGKNVDLGLMFSGITGLDNFTFLNPNGDNIDLSDSFTLSLSTEQDSNSVSVSAPGGVLTAILICGVTALVRRRHRLQS